MGRGDGTLWHVPWFHCKQETTEFFNLPSQKEMAKVWFRNRLYKTKFADTYHLIITDSLFCPRGKKALAFSLNLFAPEPPVRIHVPSTACDVISFNGQGQLCPLTCAESRDLSNHSRMSTIRSRTPEKKAKNHVTLTRKLRRKSPTLPFVSSNPKMLKASLKTIPTKLKPTKCPTKEKKLWKTQPTFEKRKNEERKRKKREGAKAKSKSQDCCVTFKPRHEILLSAHAWTSQANNFCIWISKKAAKCTNCKRLCGKF